MQNELQVAVINDEIKKAEKAKSTSETIVSNYERSIESLENQSEALDTQITDQQTAVDKLTSASSAAETVKSTKKTLEDLIFKQNLGDSSSIDMEASKKAIERKQEEVAKLRENADELEVKSSVSGTIASISASAGKSIGGEEQPLATINVTDRGFTVKIDVTNDQAKKVKTGDTAELVNFWGGDAVATLDQIASAALYTVGPEYFAAVRDEYKKRRDTLCRKLGEIPGVVFDVPGGAFYVMAALPVDDADKFQQWLLEEFSDNGETVMMAPGGSMYATPGKGKNEVRMAYVLESDKLERAMDILKKAIEVYNAR